MAPRFSTIGSMEGGVYTLNTTSFSLSDPEQANYQGATMVFVLQGTAPTGWVKDTSDNDYTLRCVTGSISSGGSSGFSSVMSSKTLSGSLSVTGTVGATSLTAAQIPAHSHGPYSYTTLATEAGVQAGTVGYAGGIPSSVYSPGVTVPSGVSPGTAAAAHSHPVNTATSPVTFSNIDLRIKYVEAILATRT